MDGPARRFRAGWVAIAGVLAATWVLAFGEALQSAFRPRPPGVAFDGWRSLGEAWPKWLLLSALAPLAFAAGRRFRFERGRLARGLVLHLAIGAVFSLLGVLAIGAYMAALRPEVGFAMMASKTGAAYAVYYLALYGAIVGAAHAVHYQRESRSRAEQLVRQRLDALRSQLDPHFLFNTLNAISTMALEKGDGRVVESLGLLGDLLRASLDDSTAQEVALSRELELADKYLAIQELRFGDRLRVERAIDGAVLDALVPSMLLQPLLENSITHGVAAVPGPGWVRIEANRVDDELRLAVSDSGSGFPAAAPSGIGLANTRERLRGLYGDGHRFVVGSAAGGGARVEVAMPCRKAPP